MGYVRKTQRPSIDKLNQIIHGVGEEPIVEKGDRYREQLLRAFNYYNARCDDKDLRKYAESYLKTNADLRQYLYAVTKASFLELKAIGIIGRLSKRGQYIAINDVFKVMEQLEQLKTKYQKPATTPTVTKAAVPTAPLTVQERIAETAGRHIGEINEHIDMCSCDPEYTFSMRSYLLTNSVSSAVARKIAEWYSHTVAEVEAAVAGKDPYLKEAYSNFTRRHLKVFLSFLQAIVADCSQQVVTAKSIRKPRARKVKPAAVVAAKVQYMKEYPELKLKSIPPAQIIGAKELWVYHPEKRKLTVFRGAHNGDLSVKGTTLQNWDIATSETKTLRKPEEFFKGLHSTKTRAMNSAWKSVKAKVSKPRARLSEDLILFAAN